MEFTQEPVRHLAVAQFEADLPRMGEQMGQAFGRVAGFLERTGVRPLGPAVGHYDVRPDGMTVSAGFVVEQAIEGDGTVVPLDLPAHEAATGVHIGSYDDLPAAYDALHVAAEARGRHLDETLMWEEYLTGPDRPPEEMRTIVHWPLAASPA
ncbi:GyrI-like domain-containing protein [Nocardioides sp. GCM10027113]|uniref:GyrI-like domain-containing protein n=1 Tax=unclassified Nocardioides TaxID=2615069 RepID=UPI003623FFF4